MDTPGAYAYWYHSHRAAAEAAGERAWPIKVGQSNRGVFQRVGEQRGSTPEAPVIGLVIASPRPRELEGLIHAELRLRGRALEAAPGREWFRTSPEEVAAVYRSIVEGAHDVPPGEELRVLVNTERPRTPANPLQCGVCLHAFSSRFNLTRHMETGKCKGPPQYSCSRCSRPFATRQGKNKHASRGCVAQPPPQVEAPVAAPVAAAAIGAVCVANAFGRESLDAPKADPAFMESVEECGDSVTRITEIAQRLFFDLVTPQNNTVRYQSRKADTCRVAAGGGLWRIEPIADTARSMVSRCLLVMGDSPELVAATTDELVGRELEVHSKLRWLIHNSETLLAPV